MGDVKFEWFRATFQSDWVCFYKVHILRLTFIGSNSRQEQRKLAKQEMSHIMATFWLNPWAAQMDTLLARAIAAQLPHRAARPHQGGNRLGRHTSATTGDTQKHNWMRIAPLTNIWLEVTRETSRRNCFSIQEETRSEEYRSSFSWFPRRGIQKLRQVWWSLAAQIIWRKDKLKQM